MIELFMAAGVVYLGYCTAKWAIGWLPGAIFGMIKITAFLFFVAVTYGFLVAGGMLS